jgi:hypothetical protein
MHRITLVPQLSSRYVRTCGVGRDESDMIIATHVVFRLPISAMLVQLGCYWHIVRTRISPTLREPLLSCVHRKKVTKVSASF